MESASKFLLTKNLIPKVIFPDCGWVHHQYDCRFTCRLSSVMISIWVWLTDLRILRFAGVPALFVATVLMLQPIGAALLQESEIEPGKQATELPPAILALQNEQENLSARYRALEEKLFSLYEFELDANPARSELLQLAFLQSQEKMTVVRLEAVTDLIAKSKLKDAEAGQTQVILELKELLDLLQSEDRGKRVRDEIERQQEYLKEVERILRMQKGVRGQTEEGIDVRRLARSQEKIVETTDRLARGIAENETKSNPPTIQSAQKEPGTDGDQGSPPAPPSTNPVSPGARQNSPPSTQPGGESNQPAGSDSAPSEDSPTDDTNPIAKQVRSAEQRMQDAQRQLDEANRNGAIESMKAAERELAKAKKDLEQILRQLREEEIERTLAMLESRFRQMLEQQVKIHDSTKKLDQVSNQQRGPDFQISTGKLAADQNNLVVDAGRALMLLKEDGSSVAFPVTVADLQVDMAQVASQLSAANVGSVTLELEVDIIESLNYLVKALVQTQEDLARMKQTRQTQSGAPGDQPLVDKLAEIKMLRGLQEQILQRHQRYSHLLADPNDPIGATEVHEVRLALERLAERQFQLTKIARDIVHENNE